MKQTQGHFYLGQFALDQSHRITAWDSGMENLTGLGSDKMIGTSEHWRFFHPEPQETIADFHLKQDVQGAKKLYGSANLITFSNGEDWLILWPFQKNGNKPQDLLIWTRQTDKGVIQYFYNASHLSRIPFLNKEQYQGMRLLAEEIPIGVCLMQDGKVILANNYMSFLFGYKSPEEMIDQPSTAILNKSEHKKHLYLMANLHKAKDTRGARYQWNGIDKQGKEIWFEGQPVPIHWNGRPAVLSLVADITHVKQREIAIKETANTLRKENQRLNSSLACRVHMGNIIGKSQKMQEIYDMIARAGFQTSTVVIYGETGTGKELVAREIHSIGNRRHQPFVPVNCGAIPEDLFESAFFGHKKGAFTGAVADKQGFLCAAHGGTLFLDEIGELSLGAQAKLLRALGTGEYAPVGCERNRKADFRLVVATNRNLEEMVKQKLFRQDLFYRIHIIPINLPPLRDRREDIPFLVSHFLKKSSSSMKLGNRDLAKLLLYDWPGNVRELQNILERYIAMGNLDFFTLPDILPERTKQEDGIHPGSPLREKIEAYERKLLLETLEECGWNRTRTSKALGVPRKTLFRKIKKYHLQESENLSYKIEP